jgi:aminopeptidase N
MAGARRSVAQFHQENPTEPLVDTTYSDPNELLNTNPYQKGAWVLHMLRHKVGTETFWDGLRAYYGQYRHQNASTRDFRAVMEDVSGQALAPFFNQWTRRPGHPVIEGTWRHDATAGECMVTLRQTQEEPPFQVPVEIRAGGDGSEVATTVQMDGREVTARFDCAEAPSTVTLDPHTWLLAELSLSRAE